MKRTDRGPACPTCGSIRHHGEEVLVINICDHCGAEEAGDTPLWIHHMEGGNPVLTACSSACFKALMAKWLAERVGRVADA